MYVVLVGHPVASIEPRQGVCGVQLRRLARDVHENVGVVHGRRQARHDLDRLNVPRVFKVGGHHKPPVFLASDCKVYAGKSATKSTLSSSDPSGPNSGTSTSTDSSP